MNTALLFLFAAETVLYSLFWHNQPARSPNQDQPHQPDRKVTSSRQNASRQEPAASEVMFGEIKRQWR